MDHSLVSLVGAFTMQISERDLCPCHPDLFTIYMSINVSILTDASSKIYTIILPSPGAMLESFLSTMVLLTIIAGLQVAIPPVVAT